MALLTILSPIRAEGEVVEVAGSSLDITERIRTERALQQREAYLRSILDNFPYKAWLKNREGEYLAVNHTFAHEAGFAPLVGSLSLFQGEIGSHMQESMQPAIQRGNTIQG